MGLATSALAEPELRQALHNYFAAPERRLLVEALRPLDRPSWRTYVFGGCLRDLALAGPQALPRDLDLVVENASNEELATLLAPSMVRRTRFGGLHLDCAGWTVDVWALSSTWAFAHGVIAPAVIQKLPLTTFLDVEAAALEMRFAEAAPGALFESGFFAALKLRQAEINLIYNPYPQLCVVRSLVLLNQLAFTAGPKLRAYLVEHGAALSDHDWLSTQTAHYGRTLYSPSQLRTLLEKHVTAPRQLA